MGLKRHACAAHPTLTLTLQTLTRGEGLLGLKPFGPLGPRGPEVTVVHIDVGVDGDIAARARLASLGLHPIPDDALQWRAPEAAHGHGDLWTLVQEDHFGAFWVDAVPELEAEGWRIDAKPGFAHRTERVQNWRFALGQPAREGSWMLSLGVEIDGVTLDLVPLLADLIQRDGRWLDADELAQIADTSIVLLHAPGGKRIEAQAAPLKAIVRAMLDLLTDPKRRDGPLELAAWDAHRLETLRLGLLDTQAARAGTHGGWQLQGDAGLRALAERLGTSDGDDKGSGRRNGVNAVAAPAGLAITLRPYQLQGVAWLQYLRQHHLAGILADDMGLGKTAQALAHLLIEKHAGRLDLPALIVLPSSIVFNWQAEAARMAPGLRVLTLQGPSRAAERPRMAAHDAVLTSYPLLWRDIRALESQPFHLLILDEAQTVKNGAGRTARAVRRIQARHRLCLTGTPLENNLSELWAQFDFLMPGFLGDARSFHRRWRKPIEENGESLRAQVLSMRVRPFILRRRKAEVATELAPQTEVIRRVQLAGAQRALYESVRVAADEQVRRVLQRRGLKGAQISILDALLKLRQVCNDPRLLKGAHVSHAPLATSAPLASLASQAPAAIESAKLDLLMTMLPALVAEGHRVLVFSQFTEMLSLIGDALDALSLPWLALTGKTAPAKRSAVVAAFQAQLQAPLQGRLQALLPSRLQAQSQSQSRSPDEAAASSAPILLVSLKAGGVGLNLTAADTVIHVDPWWNPAVEQQATARAHRIGQTKPVFVYKLVVQGSIEERLLDLQARKTALAEGILGTDGAAAAKFSVEELEGLLAPLG